MKQISRIALVMAFGTILIWLGGCDRSSPAGGENQAVAPQPAPTASHLGLRISPLSMDFGDITIGTRAAGKLTIANDGDQPVTVRDVKVSCGCPSTNLRPGTVLQPRQSIEADYWLTAGRLQQHLNRTITLEFADDLPPLVFNYHAEVVAMVKTEPSQYDRQDNPTGHIKMTSMDGKPFRITGMTPALLTEFPITESSQIEFDLPWAQFLEFVRREGSGLWHSRLLNFDTTHPDCSSVSILVNQSEMEQRAVEPPT